MRECKEVRAGLVKILGTIDKMVSEFGLEEGDFMDGEDLDAIYKVLDWITFIELDLAHIYREGILKEVKQ